MYGGYNPTGMYGTSPYGMTGMPAMGNIPQNTNITVTPVISEPPVIASGTSMLIRAQTDPSLNQITFSTPKDPKVGVPEEQHTPFIYYLMLILGTTCLTLGITALASVSGYISSAITSFFNLITGWNPILTGIIIGCIGLLLATIFFVNGARAKEVVQRIRSVGTMMQGDNRPKVFYDMDAIPIKYKIQALEKIGCKVYQDRDLHGVTIHCATIDENSVFTNVNYDLKLSRKIIQFVVLCAIPLILTASAYEGWWLYSDWEAILWFVVMAMCVVFMIELFTFPLWATIPLGWAYLLIAYVSLIGSISIAMWWNFTGIWFAYSCVVATLYYLKPDFCRPNSTICSRM